MMEDFLQLGGRLHPMVLHMPIGVIGALVIVEIWCWLRAREIDRGVRLVLVWSLVFATAAAVASGLRLATEPTYGGDTVELHRWIGIATGACIVLAALCATIKFQRGYTAMILLATCGIIPAGHFGATLTHGPTFLTEPFASATSVSPAPQDLPDGVSVYESAIAPILEAKCAACHGADRRKGGLAVHTREAILAGGSSGKPLIGDTPLDGELIRRILVPEDDFDHMPPPNKPQVTEEEKAILQAWLESGASFEAAATTVAPETSEPVTDTTDTTATTTVAPRSPSQDAIDALALALVHVEVIDPESELLWVDFSAVPEMDIEEAVRMLQPLAPFTTELSLRGMSNADELLVQCQPWDQLSNLNLSNAVVGVKGLKAVAAAPLKELSLVNASVTPPGPEFIFDMTSLEILHCWNAGIPEDLLLELQEEFPSLTINDGNVEPPPALAIEPEIVFGEPVAASLKPVNDICPVAETPVDPKFSVVHNGRVIAFCCEVCAAKFWDAPDTFTVTVAGEK